MKPVEAIAQGIGSYFEEPPGHWIDEAQAALTALGDAGFAVVDPEVLAFLMDDGPLEGVWFGERHPTRKGSFWWRTVIRERTMIAAATDEGGE